MAHYNASLDTSRPPDEMFAYLSDFSSTQEWDPGVIEAERLGDTPVREGTEFRLLTRFLGRKTPLTYRVVEYDPPNAVTFRGESPTVVSLDRITFEASEQGTRITYDADLALKGSLLKFLNKPGGRRVLVRDKGGEFETHLDRLIKPWSALGPKDKELEFRTRAEK